MQVLLENGNLVIRVYFIDTVNSSYRTRLQNRLSVRFCVVLFFECEFWNPTWIYWFGKIFIQRVEEGEEVAKIEASAKLVEVATGRASMANAPERPEVTPWWRSITPTGRISSSAPPTWDKNPMTPPLRANLPMHSSSGHSMEWNESPQAQDDVSWGLGWTLKNPLRVVKWVIHSEEFSWQ